MNASGIQSFTLLGSVLVLCCLYAIQVSAWVPVHTNNNALCSAVLSSRQRNAVTSILSTLEDSTETSIETSSTSDSTTAQKLFSVAMPKIQWTVPGMKRGWKEDEVWMDEDGPRNGPPQNFWRQVGDERIYNDNVELVQNLVKVNDFQENRMGNTTSLSFEQTADGILRNDLFDGMVARLEKTNSIRIPSLNRLILGNWAPIVRGGKVVANGNSGDAYSVDIPYRFHIERTTGQKLAPKTHYGTFDMHLEPEEQITVQEISSSNAVNSFGVVEATSDKTENKLVEGYVNSIDGDLYLGGITYVSKYIMIMRQQPQQSELEGGEDRKGPKGPVTEIWMRVDSD